jgi:hypothetical protein
MKHIRSTMKHRLPSTFTPPGYRIKAMSDVSSHGMSPTWSTASFTHEPADAVKVNPEGSIVKLLLTKARLPHHWTKGDTLNGITAHRHGGKPPYKHETWELSQAGITWKETPLCLLLQQTDPVLNIDWVTLWWEFYVLLYLTHMIWK